MNRVLITGCSGFIGSRLALRAKAAGLSVTASARAASPVLERELGMPVMPLDVLNPPQGIPEVDAIIHCATANDILSRDFEAGMRLSVTGTRNLMELAVRHGARRVVFLSTLQVYGAELQGAIDEATPPRCESAYALNHYFGEEVCRMVARNHGLDVVALRPANVYGVPDVSTVNRATLVPMCFVEEALTGGAITLRSSGNQFRNFISTGEVADICLGLLADFPKGFEVVNAASNWQSSVREIAEETCRIYRQRFGTELTLSVLSDKPEKGNQFTINSRYSGLRGTVESSRGTMVRVISELFDHFQKGQS